MNWAIEYLRKRGFMVYLKESVEMATPAQLGRRFGLSSATIHYRLAHAQCPHTGREYGMSGRLTKLVVTSELLEWLGRPLAKGERTDLLRAVA